MIRRLGLVAVVAALGGVGAARAEGLELSARFGGGGAGGESPVRYRPAGGFLGTSAALTYFNESQGDTIATGRSSPYRAGPMGQLQIGYRPISWLSFGIGGGARLASSSAPSSSYDQLTRWGWSVGPYVRVDSPQFAFRGPPGGSLPKIGAFRVWESLGLYYAADRQTYTDARIMTWLTHRGLAIPLTFGVDYRLSDAVAIGPSFELARVLPLSACSEQEYVPNHGYETGMSAHSCSGDNESLEARAYTTWSIAFGTRVSLLTNQGDGTKMLTDCAGIE